MRHKKFFHYNWEISVHICKWWLKVLFKILQPFCEIPIFWRFLTMSYFVKWSVCLCRKCRVLTNGLSVSFGDVVYGWVLNYPISDHSFVWCKSYPKIPLIHVCDCQSAKSFREVVFFVLKVILRSDINLISTNRE